MALSDPSQIARLVSDMKFYLPDSNTLTDDELERILNQTIARVGDDDSNYSEVLCKALESAGYLNHSRYLVEDAPVVSEKVGELQTRWSEDGNKDVWLNWINNLLKNVCPMFGYTPSTRGIGIKINPSAPIDINPNCPCPDDLFL